MRSAVQKTQNMLAKARFSNLPASAVLSTVHLLYSLLEQLLILARWIRRKIGAFKHNAILTQKRGVEFDGGDSSNRLRLESDLIVYGVRELKKIPSHLVVLLGPEVPDYRQLAKFVFWGMSAGVGHVSFYDHKGILKQNHQQMLHYVLEHPRADSEQIVWTPKLKSSNGLLPPRNGYRRRVVVSFFSPEDAKHQLVMTARTISSALIVGSIPTSEDINIELVDRELQDHFHHVPDPELAVYFGKICSTYGLLPWHIRLTEFVPLETTSLDKLDVGHFLDCLYKYAKCEQRFGK